MNNYQTLLSRFAPSCEAEASDLFLIRTLCQDYGERILTRELPFAHMTCSGLILNEGRTRTLMVFHNLYQAWTFPGGHCDGEADLAAVALREAFEETGVPCRLLTAGESRPWTC